MQNEQQYLQNSADTLGLTIYEKFTQDKRKSVKMFFACKGETSVSPVLDYEGLNNFLCGWRNAIKKLKNEN